MRHPSDVGRSVRPGACESTGKSIPISATRLRAIPILERHVAETVANDVIESDEWKRATSQQITDEDVARAQSLTGYDEASREREYVQTATLDTIRNFAHGVG